MPVSDVIIQAPTGTARPPFTFTPDHEHLLDEVQRGAFNFLWNASKDAGPGMVPDRASKPTVSVAGVGFQLSGICIGVERGWITRKNGEDRAIRILAALDSNPTNRKAGMFYHFLDPATAGPPPDAPEYTVSTIDSALLFAGVLTAAQYFGGDVRTLADALFEGADWRFFLAGPRDRTSQGFVTLGWKPTKHDDPTGEGELLPYAWIDAGDEHRLVTFLAVCAPTEARRVEPRVYYRLRRQLGEFRDTGPMVWFPWSGALFTQLFAHCWIDYAAMPPDNPAAFSIPNRPRADWWENSRRHVRLHRLKALDAAGKVPTLGENAWGLSASDVHDGYAVPGVFPDPLPMPGAFPELDYPVYQPKDNLGDGTVAPYAAGSSVMFDPDAALAALAYYRSLPPQPGQPALWSDPQSGGFGFADAFNLGTGWVAPDYVAIDQGPLLLAIENARTGFVWKTFHAHPWVRAGMERLKLSTTRAAPPADSGDSK
ncbi:hypothetical protein PHYC_00592 [Phycisphaerales bacterium]|nr:hypothetical protein PHYC_00592 [Phycisphaerales bacterium]